MSHDIRICRGVKLFPICFVEEMQKEIGAAHFRRVSDIGYLVACTHTLHIGELLELLQLRGCRTTDRSMCCGPAEPQLFHFHRI